MVAGFPIQPVFSRGELSERLHARADIEYYKAGLAIARNFFVLRQGGLRRRPGTQFIARTKNGATETARLHFFVFSQAQAYIIEFGPLYARFYALGGQVQSGMAAYEVATPYQEQNLFELQFAQSADVLYIAHRSYQPRKLVRIAETNWTLSVVVFLDGPYLTPNITATTFTPSGTAAGTLINITASSIVGVNGGVGFRASDVGRPIRILHGTTWGWARVVSITSTLIVTAHVGGALGATTGAFGAITASAVWMMGAWTTELGYPGRVGFFQERLIWASSTSYPQTLWASQTADLENHGVSSPANDADAVNVTIVAGSVQEIQWIQEGQDLLIGTTSTARTLGPSDRGTALSATNIVQRPQANFGAYQIQPVQVGNVTLFATIYGQAIREFVYSFDVDAYVAPEVTTLSEHALRPGIVQMAYVAEPNSIVWLALRDGRLGALTYERDQKMVALTRHEIGGAFDDNEFATVESVASIPGLDRSELWMIVKRRINGATTRSVERLTKGFESTASQAFFGAPAGANAIAIGNAAVEDMNNAFFVDSGLVYDGIPTNTVSGAIHLMGEEVLILADGNEIRGVIVSPTGVATLPNGQTASNWTLGIPYRSYGRTLRVPAQQDGSLIGRKVKAQAIILDLLESASLQVSSGSFKQDITQRRKTTAVQGNPIPLTTGAVRLPIDASWDSGGVLDFECSHARPVTIRAITPAYEAEP